MDVERLRRLPLFGELDHHDLTVLARMARDVDVPDGEFLVQQGDLPYELFVIEDGTAEVVHDGQRVADLGPGDVVGEMGVLKRQRRWGSVRATSDLRAVAIDTDGLASMAEDMPELIERIEQTMARRDLENQ
jgi:CRP-like cAMP-binding protein